jgi:hypothetical protein
VAYDQLDLRLARAESTTSTVDDDAANRALILLERGRIGTVRKELSDPRFRTIKGTDQLKAGLLSEQAGLIRSIYSQQQTITQARDAKLQALLSPHDQYLLDRAIARNDVSTQAMYYRRELVELEKLRKGAVAKGQWSYADQIEQQIASVQSSLQGLSGTQPSSQVISDLQAQAEALLGPGEAFTREAASGAFGKGAVKAGRRAAASFGGEGLAAVAEGAITINVNTLGVNDPRTKLAIGRSITASVQQAHRRRQPNRRTRL